MSVVNQRHKDVRFSTFLRLIVTHSHDAVERLKLAHKNAELPRKGGFLCYTRQNLSWSCDCWFTLEYFDFIQDKFVDPDMLNDVCDTIDRGKCGHCVKHEQRGEDPAEFGKYFCTSLMHAAAASGNMAVVEFLADIDSHFSDISSQTGLVPFHVAVIKSQHKVYKHLHKITKVDPMQHEHFMAKLVLVNRSMANMILYKEKIVKNDKSDVISNLLELFNITDTETVRNLAKMNIINNTNFEYLVMYMLLKDAINVAFAVLSIYPEINKSRSNERAEIVPATLAHSMAVPSILCDADQFLKLIIVKSYLLKLTFYGYNMLDIALAFGNSKCASILQRKLVPTPGIYSKLSPFNFLLKASSWKIDGVGTVLLKKCLREGFDVNAIDEEHGIPPLHVAIPTNDTFVKPLLRAGADIDCKYFGKTPVCLSISLTAARWGYSALNINILKSLLYHNPVPDKTRNALYLAVIYDLHAIVCLRITSKNTIRCSSDETIGGIAASILARTTEDKIMAVSAFALLHEIGFSTEYPCEKILQQNENVPRPCCPHAVQSRGKMLSDKIKSDYQTYRDFVLHTISCPRSLKSASRIAIRKAYPGNTLHDHLRETPIPRLLKEYIAYPQILWQTTMESYVVE